MSVAEDRRVLEERGFRCEDKLGDGGQGRVYRAFDFSQNLPVAVKITDCCADSSSGREDESLVVARINQEYRVLRDSAHPCLLSVYYLNECYHLRSHYIWFSMELCHATVAEALWEAGLRTRVQWVFQLLDALAYLHQQGVSHRDIKPANLLLVDALGRRLKVGDFGTAKLLRHFSVSDPDSRYLIGSQQYMAPELWVSTPDCLTSDGYLMATDQYAAGLTIYEILARQLPLSLERVRRNRGLCQQAHMEGVVNPAFKLTIPEKPGCEFPRVNEVLKDMLAKDRRQRYAPQELSRCKLDLMSAMFMDELLIA